MTPFAEMLRTLPWGRALTDDERAQVEGDVVLRTYGVGQLVCRKGERVEHWVGIVEGLVKMANVSADGRPTSFTGIGSGGWFGEGSLLKDEPRRYDIVALRETVAAFLPRATFMALLDRNLAFNRFLLVQLNERLSQFIGMVEHGRLLGPDARVARGLAALFNPVLYPGHRRTLPISQEEIGQLVGLSRQRANQALQRLQAAGLLAVDYGAVTVLDLDGLRAFDDGGVDRR